MLKNFSRTYHVLIKCDGWSLDRPHFGKMLLNLHTNHNFKKCFPQWYSTIHNSLFPKICLLDFFANSHWREAIRHALSLSLHTCYLTTAPVGECCCPCFTEEENDVGSYYTVKLGIKLISDLLPNSCLLLPSGLSAAPGGKSFTLNMTNLSYVTSLTAKKRQPVKLWGSNMYRLTSMCIWISLSIVVIQLK